MPISAKSVRIGGSVLIAVLMVALGYILPGINAPKTKTVNAELTDELLAAYVAKDTDADNLPDWQEVLYGTDANKADTDGDGVNDGEAVRRGLLTPTSLASQIPNDPIGENELPGEAPAPGSITDEFAKSFFEAFIAAGGGQPMDPETQQALVEELILDFGARAAEALNSSYSRVSVRTATGMSATTYAGSVEQALRANDVPQGYGEPFPLMFALMEEEDETARPKLRVLATSYENIAEALVATPAPAALADEHTTLVRSFDTLARATRLVADYEKDPVGVLGAITTYMPTSQAIIDSFKSIATSVLSEGEPGTGMPGAMIVNVVRSAEQQP